MGMTIPNIREVIDPGTCHSHVFPRIFGLTFQIITTMNFEGCIEHVVHNLSFFEHRRKKNSHNGWLDTASYCLLVQVFWSKGSGFPKPPSHKVHLLHCRSLKELQVFHWSLVMSDMKNDAVARLCRRRPPCQLYDLCEHLGSASNKSWRKTQRHQKTNEGHGGATAIVDDMGIYIPLHNIYSNTIYHTYIYIDMIYVRYMYTSLKQIAVAP